MSIEEAAHASKPKRVYTADEYDLMIMGYLIEFGEQCKRNMGRKQALEHIKIICGFQLGVRHGGLDLFRDIVQRFKTTHRDVFRPNGAPPEDF